MSKPVQGGLREKKKADRQRRILSVAFHLFRAGGFEATSMGQIAGEANVAVGTLYNYYPSKDMLLIATLKEALRQKNEDIFSVPETPGDDPAAYLFESVDAFLSVAKEFDKGLWFEFASAVYGAQRKLDSPVFELDWMLINNSQQRIEILKRAGMIGKDVNSEQVALLIFGAVWMRFQMYLMIPEMTVDVTKQQILFDFRTLLKGIEPRNGR